MPDPSEPGREEVADVSNFLERPDLLKALRAELGR